MTTLSTRNRLSTLSREITALTDRLAPASDDAILRSLNAMQTAGMTMPQGIDPGKLLPVYKYALAGVPACGLSAATQKLIRGDYATNANVLLGTIPKPPVLAALAKGEAAATRAELARRRDLAEALNPTVPAAERSPEIRERVRVRLRQFRAEHTAAKAMGAAPRETPSPERAGALAELIDLPDAAEVMCEQRAFRAGVERDMAHPAGRGMVMDLTMEVASDAA
ncbi:hypothetical protein [Ensifer adhaerens]|uniref:hypothetical protein n=1 Tax=Ensifer adhaerens TaxID=106592 RepID=UPI0007C66D00|nr:hypothetical protein [Ensifer adhaerens]